MTIVKRPSLSVAVVMLGFAFAAPASAQGPVVVWSKKDMTTALRAIGYPRPHARKLTCSGHTSFRCVALYRHHRRRVFRTQGRGEGGWICAGKRVATCKILRHGFVTTANASLGLEGASEITSTGYLQDRYGVINTYRAGPCSQTDSTAWSCPYHWTGDSTLVVTVAFRHAQGGYVTTASQS